ncbi:MAG: GNAT family N-acetyltransferase [Bryobacteraceae bacterium]
MSAADIPVALGLCRASGWNQVEDDWRVFLTLPASHCFVAEKSGQVVGTVATLDFQTCAWIAMMLVDPRERGSGIGSQLFEKALAALSCKPCVALDASSAGEPLYRRRGFVDCERVIRTRAAVEGECLTQEIGIRTMSEADLPRVFQLDRDSFGGDRSLLLTLLFHRAPQWAWIAEHGIHLAGYCFGRQGHLYGQIGPIVAEREDVARGLVSRCLLGQHGKSIVIDAPAGTPAWLPWLASAGFVEDRRFTRMYRGEIMQLSTNLHYGIAGPEFG